MAKKKNKIEPIIEHQEIPTPIDRLEELYKIWGDVEYFGVTYCTVWHKQLGKRVPFKLLPTQRRVIKGYDRYPKNLVLKYRQGGISTVTELYLAHLIISTPDIKIAIVANNIKLARKFLKETTDFVSNLPAWIGITPVKDAAEYKIYNNKTEIMALAATKDGVRGWTPDILVIDEAAYLDNGADFWTSARGSMSAGGRIFMISTPNSHDPVYYMTYEGAINKRDSNGNGFNVIEIRWWEDSRFNHDLRFKLDDHYVDDVWLKNNGEKTLDLVRCFELIKSGYQPTSRWYEDECAGYEQSPRRIAQELNNSFIGSGGNLVNQESIEYQDRQNVRAPLRVEYRDKNLWIWAEPKPEGRYVIGVDGSSGNSDDYAGIQVIDIDTGEQCAEYQGRLKPEELGELVFQIGMRYNQGFVVMDVTGGSGSVPMLQLLQRGYKNIYYNEGSNKAVKEKLEGFLDNDGRIPGFIISTNRPVILVEFEKYIRLRGFIIRSTRLMSEIKTFVWDDKKQRYDHPRTGHDDLLFAATIAFAGISKYNQAKIDSEKAAKMASLWCLSNNILEPSAEPTSSKDTPLILTTNSSKQIYQGYTSPFNGNQYHNEIQKYMHLLLK